MNVNTQLIIIMQNLSLILFFIQVFLATSLCRSFSRSLVTKQEVVVSAINNCPNSCLCSNKVEFDYKVWVLVLNC